MVLLLGGNLYLTMSFGTLFCFFIRLQTARISGGRNRIPHAKIVRFVQSRLHSLFFGKGQITNKTMNLAATDGDRQMCVRRREMHLATKKSTQSGQHPEKCPRKQLDTHLKL